MPTYIWELPDWPNFTYDPRTIQQPLVEAVRQHGNLLGLLEGLGFAERDDAKLEALADEVVHSSEIEGESLDAADVRSSIARRLGLESGGVPSGDHRVEGVVEMAIDAATNWTEPLTEDRLFQWQAGLFPGGRGPHGRVRTGAWRDGPMQVVSGPEGRHRVHFEAPPNHRLSQEMAAFLDWFESAEEPNRVLQAGIAHLWFETIHPFDDGNGRVGRAVLDLALARYDRKPWRCYSVSTQIREERRAYYDELERAQGGTLDATPWLVWFLGCLQRALEASTIRIGSAMSRAAFWRTHAAKPFNERQRKVLSRMLLDWQGNMSNKKWQTLTGAIDRTASRDLDQLVEWGVFRRVGSGRTTSYELVRVEER
ncbi:MAG: Fic family protein [Fimbriimonadaceae bacterium]|nr:Fic family protein [Fimbriimonadaceae bacterium]